MTSPHDPHPQPFHPPQPPQQGPRNAPPPGADASVTGPAPRIEFNPVSPKLVWAHLAGLVLWMLPTVIALIVLGVIFAGFRPWMWAGLGLSLVITVWTAIVIVRQVRRLGYAERADDLLIRRGILFRSTTVVPFGRMQFVDVKSGPIDRMLGLATVELHTASASTDASIPGLPAAEADRLRDALAARGEARLAGL